MNYVNLNGLRSMQVMLKEAWAYKGSIDGQFGKGTLEGVLELFSVGSQGAGGQLVLVDKFPQDPLRNSIAKIQQVAAIRDGSVSSIDGLYGPETYRAFYAIYRRYLEKKAIKPFDACWSKKVSKAFIARIREWVKKRGLPDEAVNWLMACMYFESAGTFDPTIRNKGGSYFFGLIQFGKDAASDLGTSVPELIKMTQMEQLEYVFKYFDFWAKVGKKYTQLEDFYLTIFYPKAVGKKANEVLFDKNDPKFLKAYTQNKGFDLNNDGLITVGEISTLLYDAYFQGMDTNNRVLL